MVFYFRLLSARWSWSRSPSPPLLASASTSGLTGNQFSWRVRTGFLLMPFRTRLRLTCEEIYSPPTLTQPTEFCLSEVTLWFQDRRPAPVCSEGQYERSESVGRRRLWAGPLLQPVWRVWNHGELVIWSAPHVTCFNYRGFVCSSVRFGRTSCSPVRCTPRRRTSYRPWGRKSRSR